MSICYCRFSILQIYLVCYYLYCSELVCCCSFIGMGVPNECERAELSRFLTIVKKDVNTQREDAIIERCRYIIEQCEHAIELKRELFETVRFGEQRAEILDYWRPRLEKIRERSKEATKGFES